MPKLNKQAQRNLDLKRRYQVYRSLGYSSIDARKLSQHKSINVDDIKLTKNTHGKRQVVKNQAYYNIAVESETKPYIEKNKNITNDSVYTNWGYLTHKEPYKTDTMKLARKIARRDHQTLDYGYYYLYLMYTQQISNNDLKSTVKSDKSFEIYTNRSRNNAKSKHKTKTSRRNLTISQLNEIIAKQDQETASKLRMKN